MKSTFLKSLVTILVLVFMIGCSVDNIEKTSIEQVDRISSPVGVILDPSWTAIQVNYDPSSSPSQREATRHSFYNNPFINLVHIEPCSSSPNVEIWYCFIDQTQISTCDQCENSGPGTDDVKTHIESDGGVNKASVIDFVIVNHNHCGSF